jgi:3-oxoacyl-[acyl-carrier-protein] synthase-3
MSGNIRARITGTGMYVPDKIVTNKDLEKFMDTTDEWIRQRSGVEERRWVEDGIAPSDLGLIAAEKAIEAAGIKATDIDMIVVASLSPGYYFPGVSAFIQTKLGLETTPAFDVRAQCTGFIFSLDIGRCLIESGNYKKVLVVGAEVHSAALDLTTRGRDIAVLFGDGAGAVILEPSDDPERGIMSTHLYTEGSKADMLCVKYPGTSQKPYIRHEDLESGIIYPRMQGKHVFKSASTRMPQVVREALTHNNLTVDDVDMFLFHQANLRINEMVLKQLGAPASKTYNNIMKYGNCSAASAPIVLDECIRSGKVKPGDIVCMTGFGAGYTWGSALMRY